MLLNFYCIKLPLRYREYWVQCLPVLSCRRTLQVALNWLVTHIGWRSALFQDLNSLVDTLTQNTQRILLRTASCSPKREGSKLDSHSSVCCYRIASPRWFGTMMCIMATVVNASVSVAFNKLIFWEWNSVLGCCSISGRCWKEVRGAQQVHLRQWDYDIWLKNKQLCFLWARHVCFSIHKLHNFCWWISLPTTGWFWQSIK